MFEYLYIIWLAFTPYTLFLLLGIWRVRRSSRPLRNDPVRFIVQITTNGKAPSSVRKIIEALRGYNLSFPYETWTVTEEYDANEYRSDITLRVPRGYTTPNGSRAKARALCYARSVRINKGLVGEDTKLLLLDDDSIPSREYMEDSYHSEFDIGQGIIAPRIEYGASLLASIRDNTRTSDCIALCSYFNAHGNARIVHGEGLMVRSNVEVEVGWDFGQCLAEDLVFGRRATRKFRFGFINAFIEIAPPRTWGDFLVQRRRWLWGMITAFPLLDLSERFFLLGRSLTTTFFGLVSWPLIFYDLFFHIQVAPIIRWLFIVNTAAFVAYELVGNWYNTHRLKRLAEHLVLLYPAALLEAVSTVFALLTRPKGFDVIRKS